MDGERPVEVEGWVDRAAMIAMVAGERIDRLVGGRGTVKGRRGHTCEPDLEEAEDEEDYVKGGESLKHPDQQVNGKWIIFRNVNR